MENIKEIISQMTLEEKAGLCSGLDAWHTKAVERLGIPSIMVTDGPIGLRKQPEGVGDLALGKSVPATCFPSGSALASSWDRKLLEQVGSALGEECQANGVSILLGPAVNIKRSPLGGRDFEYYSEDPFLSSELGIGFVNGVQSQDVGTSLKHFAANNQESNRLTTNENISERALHEIYLASFERTVKQAQPWTVMCAYNQVNGEFCSENREILTTVLKEEWGHEGFVMSDWGAVDDRVKGLAAGMELEMPSSNGVNDRKIVEAVKTGKLSVAALDRAVERLLTIILRAVHGKKESYTYDAAEHHALASRVEEECIVLLKNSEGALPLKKQGNYAVLGSFAEKPRYQGGGSSHVNPSKLEKPLDELKKAAPDAVFTYAPGFEVEASDNIFTVKALESACDTPNDRLIGDAVQTAAGKDAAILFLGLPESYESEGYDRVHMRLPEGQEKLLEAVLRVQSHVIVVLQNGSAVEMPWADQVDGILECYLGGQAGGSAMARTLFGDVNPSGKLAETFPKKLSDTPCFLDFPGDGRTTEYREGIYVGYRYYEAKELEPRFPFGFGLSYTTFRYEGISVDKASVKEDEPVTVTVRVKNAGARAGKEIVELYVRDKECSVYRPRKELKGFAKVELQPGEEKAVSLKLERDAFAFFSEKQHHWTVESGDFEILAGPSSAETPLHADIHVESLAKKEIDYGRNTTLFELFKDEKAAALVKHYFPMVEKMPMSFFGTVPVRSLGMFGHAEIVEELLRKLNGLSSMD